MADTTTQPPSQSTFLTPSAAQHLAHTNLLGIFSCHDPEKRAALIPSIFTPTATLHEPNSLTITTHTAISSTVTNLLSPKPGWEFIPLGPVQLNADFIYLKWGFGPRTKGVAGSGDAEGVDVKATGSDHILVDEKTGLIQRLWVVIDGVADVK